MAIRPPEAPRRDEAAQSFDVKRAEVEFHNFASLGEPERASRIYREENVRRGAVLKALQKFVGPLTPFLEIGANAGHTSLMLENEFGARGFALDISADSLRHGYALMDQWGVTKGPVRMAGDALRLPFRDGSLQTVFAFQMLSQFMDIESVLVEVKRVLAPGGVFFFAEEPMRRWMTLRLWRCPYEEQMKPWERRLNRWGVLPFLVQDVIGAGQEESFGIRQNHTMNLGHWHALIQKHFGAQEYRLFVPERGWLERAVKKAAVRLDPYGSEWRAARLLGGTLAAACRKAGPAIAQGWPEVFEALLQCPDCGGQLTRDAAETLACTACDYSAPLEGGVYNLLNSRDRHELYPGDRPDIIDFSRPGHEAALGEGWYELEGVFGNRYRWIGAAAHFHLTNTSGGRQRLRIRGYRQDRPEPTRLAISLDGVLQSEWILDRPGLFVIESVLPEQASYPLSLAVAPVARELGGDRVLGVNLSLIRLLPPLNNGLIADKP
ncbi:MAG: class I SAM-dependent methyltransferase [Acidobacteria bacterium]|nr:class I SAM-dependent methyltransferase [Acidobacteriota bacterium]